MTGVDVDQVEWLVRRARRGHDVAFRELLEAHRKVVVSTLFACGVRSSETAEDLAQDVALKAWQGLASLKQPRAFPAWIRRIAANAARDHLRRMAVRREEDLERALLIEDDSDPHDHAERVAEVRLMVAALAGEDDDVVRLLMARATGVSIEVLAAEMDLTADAVKMRVMRARKRLRKRLEGLRGSPEPSG